MILLLAAIQNPPTDTGPAAGSLFWQLIFISFACVLVLLEILRGWRRGLPRQMVRLAAIAVAYFIGYFGGNLLVPLVRPFLHMPDPVLSVVAGAVLALVVYVIISLMGNVFFRRTGQHESFPVRLIYGTTGAFLGIFFGVFIVWLCVVGIRSLGSIAEPQVRQQAAAAAPNGSATPRPLHAVDVRTGRLSGSSEEAAPLMTTLTRLKNSIELGTVGEVVKKNDVIPSGTYDTLSRIGTVASDPDRAQRFLSYPGAQEITQHPKIVALRDDAEIRDILAQGRYLELLQNQKIIDATNDPELKQEIKLFKLQDALDYALKKD